MDTELKFELDRSVIVRDNDHDLIAIFDAQDALALAEFIKQNHDEIQDAADGVDAREMWLRAARVAAEYPSVRAIERGGSSILRRVLSIQDDRRSRLVRVAAEDLPEDGRVTEGQWSFVEVEPLIYVIALMPEPVAS